MARKDFLDGEEIVNRLNKAFEEHKRVVIESTAALSKLQGEYSKLPSDYLKMVKEISNALKSEAQAEKELANARKANEQAAQAKIKTERDELNLKKQKAAVQDKEVKNLQREAAKLAAAESLYAKLNQKLRELTLEYRDLAARRELGIQLSDKEAKRLAYLEGRIKKYDGALKAVDAGMGKYQRNVGNYASAFNPLQNSITQLSREMPAFSNSVQTGFMAISNNLPVFFDAISQANSEIKALRAQGQQVPGLFKQLTSSLLSWGTALSIGVTLLTVYSKEIGEFFSEIFKGSKSIDVAKESLKSLTEIRNEGLKSITQEKIELENNLKTAQDVTLSYKDREIAAQKVLDQYPYWFKNLGKEAIMNGDVEEAVKGVNDALLARAKANAAVGKITENQSKVIDIEEERLKVAEKMKKAQEQLDRVQNRSYAASNAENQAQSEAEAIGRLQNLRREDAKLLADKNALEQINLRLVSYSLEETKKAIGLDYQEKNSTEAKTEALKDFIASQYELNRTRLENEASALERIFQSEEVNLKAREEAYKKYHEIKSELAAMQRDEELRILNEATQSEVAELRRRAKEGEITEKNANAVIYSLQKQASFDSLKIHEDYAENIRQVNISLEESMKGVWNAINFQKAQNLIDERDLRQTQEYADTLAKITSGTDYKKFEDAQKQFAESSREITKANIKSEIDRIEVELIGLQDTEANVQKRLELQNQLMDKQKEMTNVTKEESDEQLQAWAKLQKATEEYLNGISKSFLADAGFGSLNTFFDGTFDKLIEGANTVGEKFAVTFNAITSVAQEAFAFMQQNSQAYFDAQYARLNQEKELALKYAGESTEAKEEIERQYQERQRQLRIQEWKANRDAALFNIALNMAQGITAALASVPPNPVLAATIGAIGLAQAALVASRPIPAYFKGTDNHTGGLMLVNDAPGSKYKEVIETPSGQIYTPQGRNVVMDAPKGTKVHKNYDSFRESLERMLDVNDIAPFASTLFRQIPDVVINNGGGGITKDDLDRVMSKHFKSIKTVNNILDKNGFSSWVGDQHTRTIDLNNFKNNKGLSV